MDAQWQISALLEDQQLHIRGNNDFNHSLFVLTAAYTERASLSVQHYLIL